MGQSSVLIRVRGAQWGNKGKVGKGLALGLRHHPWQGAGRGSAQVPEAVRGVPPEPVYLLESSPQIYSFSKRH